jgi:hypothetical protein
MNFQFPCDDVQLEDLGVHTTRVDDLTRKRLNELRRTADSLRAQFPGFGGVLMAQVDALADAIAAGGKL